MYFECHLPKNAPYWMSAEIAGKFTDDMQRIHERFRKLNEAHDMSGLRGEDFSRLAKVYFDANPELFDSWSASVLSEHVLSIWDGKKAPTRMEWPNANVVIDCDFVSTKEWESARHIGIGGSDASVVMGTAHFSSPAKLYCDKTGIPLKEKRDSKAIFERGHVMEGNVVKAFCSLAGAEVVRERRMFSSKKYPVCTANIDAIVRIEDKLYVFEAKSAMSEKYLTWNDGKIPPEYVPQTRQYPAVLDDPRIQGTFIGCLFMHDMMQEGYFLGASYSKGQMTIRFVDRDEEEEQEQLEAEQQWFETYVEGCEMPETGGSSIDQEVFKATYPGMEDTTRKPVEIQADGNEFLLEPYDETCQKISDLKSQLENLTAEKQRLEQKICENLLCGATHGVIDYEDHTCREVTYKPDKGRRTCDLERLESVLEIADVYLPDPLRHSFRSCIKETQAVQRFHLGKRKRRTK